MFNIYEIDRSCDTLPSDLELLKIKFGGRAHVWGMGEGEGGGVGEEGDGGGITTSSDGRIMEAVAVEPNAKLLFLGLMASMTGYSNEFFSYRDPMVDGSIASTKGGRRGGAGHILEVEEDR
jgi:hypothetical protein